MKKVTLLAIVVILAALFVGCGGGDKTAPVISGVSASGMTSSATTITWTTDEPATSQVEYGTTTSYGSSTTLDANLVTSHGVTLTGLTASTTYHYQVKSKDKARNERSSADCTLTTLGGITPPTATLSVQPTGVVSYNTTDITVAGTDVVAYKCKLDTGAWNTETPVSTHITLSGLSDGTHTVSVIGKDAAGNWQTEASATTASWTVDTTPPTATLSGQPTGTVNYNTTDITIAGADVVSYKYKLDTGNWSAETSVATHITLSGLADGLHTVSVIGKDAAGDWQAEALATTASWTVAAPVTFPDPNLEAAIREALGKPVGDIYASDLAGLTNLNANFRGITNLTGMEYCTSLTGLGLDENQISDLSPLSSLTNLTWLYLSNNEISDLSPLSSLTSLTELDLSNNEISDLSPLSSLTSLTGLGLYENQISDLSPLSSLTSLTELDLWWNQISDLSPLSSLTSLTELNLGWNQISDLSPLSSLTSLTGLSLYGNQISDIEPLVNNPGLGQGDIVDLSGNPLNATSVNTYIPQLVARGVVIMQWM